MNVEHPVTGHGTGQSPIVIIGAGIAGLSVAYSLLERGETDIIVLERDKIGSGSTGKSAGMLVCEPESATWSELAHTYGAPTALRYWNAQMTALRTVERIIHKAGIRCGAETKAVMIFAANPDREKLAADAAARHTIGIDAELLEKPGMWEEFAAHDYAWAERSGMGLALQPEKFIRGFAEYLRGRGVDIREYSPVSSVTEDAVRTAHEIIPYRHLFLCTGASAKHPQLKNYLSTVAVTEKLPAAVRHKLRSIERVMFIDTQKRSFHYGKLTYAGKLMVGYGDILSNGMVPETYVHQPHARNIETYIRRTLGLSVPLERIWSAEYSLSTSLLPVVRRAGKQSLVNGAGTQLASIAAADFAAADMLGRKHPLQALF